MAWHKSTERAGYLVSSVELGARRFETQVFSLIEGTPDFSHIWEEAVALTLTEARHNHGTILHHIRKAHEQGLDLYQDTSTQQDQNHESAHITNTSRT